MFMGIMNTRALKSEEIAKLEIKDICDILKDDFKPE